MALQYIPVIVLAMNSLALDPKKDCDKETFTLTDPEYSITSKKENEFYKNKSYDLAAEILYQSTIFPNPTPPKTEENPELEDERHDKCNKAKAAKEVAENYLRFQHPTTDEEKDLESQIELYQSDIDYYCNQ